MKHQLAIYLLSLIALSASAQERGGQVQIPLELYNQLIETTRTPSPRPAPLNFPPGNAAVPPTVTPAASPPRGHVLAVPLPLASSIQLTATFPGSGLDVTVIPASGVRVSQSGSQTSVSATVPSTSGVQIAWRAPSDKGPTLSRATYRGEVSKGAVLWRAELRVELFEDETATVPLLPGSLTLTSLTVDGKEAPILLQRRRFATIVRGRGAHAVVAAVP